jgi:hypothetical protein
MLVKQVMQVTLFAMLLGMSLGTAHSALIEHNLIVEPNFVHQTKLNSSVNEIESLLTIPLPELTLAPGDLLRVTLEFADGKYLKRGPTPLDGFQETNLQLIVSKSGNSIGAGASGDGGTFFGQALNLLSQVVFEQAGESGYRVLSSQQILNYTTIGLGNAIDPHEPTDLTIKSVLFELQMPTFINSFAGSFPYTTTTFAGNSIEIEYSLFYFDLDPMVDVAVYVVPEPGTLSLLSVVAIGACYLRRS